jgi:hypothetical protein
MPLVHGFAKLFPYVKLVDRFALYLCDHVIEFLNKFLAFVDLNSTSVS